MPLIYSDWWPCEKMATWRQTQGEKALWRWRQWMERCSCKGAQRFPAATRSEEEARKDSLRSVREPGPLTAWSWTSRPQNCCSFKQLGLRVFVTTALGNEYTAQLGRFPGSPCTSAQKSRTASNVQQQGLRKLPQQTNHRTQRSFWTQNGLHN